MSDLDLVREGAITIATLNRPHKLNALDPSLIGALTDAVAEFGGDSAQRVLILTGAGDRAFSAGADLAAMKSGAESSARIPMSYRPDIAGLGACEKPIIAAINGLAVGGGFELALCCDIRVAAAQAWFALPEPSRGFLAGVAAVRLGRELPPAVAADVMLAGARLTADDAFRWGLIQAVCPTGDVMSAALERAHTMAESSQPALWGTKDVLRYARDLQIAEHQRYYEAVAHRVLLSGDMFEGLAAFAEKRKPAFAARWPSVQPPARKRGPRRRQTD